MIDIGTKFVTLIGTPLSQSFAARMQNAAYRAAGLNMRYFYTETDAGHLGDILNGIRYMPSFAGCAVTKPNKVRVLEYLDELDPLCEKMGACNTVLRTADNRLIGYNTDAVGFYRSIAEETELKTEGMSCFCIGAGGAGRAVCFALAYKNAGRIYITDKLGTVAEELVRDINRSFGKVAELVPFPVCAAIRDCSLVVNASGVGMGDTLGQIPIPMDFISGEQVCFDACYNPEKTQFLLEAEKKGCPILSGLGMSLYQGAAQMELWTGRPAPIEAMRAELRRLREENRG